jgi:hypothetical protein
MSDDHALIDVGAGVDVAPLAGSWDVDPTHSAHELDVSLVPTNVATPQGS